MARILLLNSNRCKQPWPVMPFGLCCVATACKRAGFQVRLVDLCFSTNCTRDIVRAVDTFQPDVAGVGIRNIDTGNGLTNRFMLDEVSRDVVQPLKAAFSGPIVIGGPAVGISAEAMLDFFDLEYAVRGDGEPAIVELVRRVAAKQSLKDSPGIVIRGEGKTLHAMPPCRAADLDTPLIESLGQYIDYRRYARYDSPIQIQTKRGCALHCSYCTYNRIEGHVYRLRDVEQVVDEIERLTAETGIDHVEFVDSTFNVPLDHAKAVLRALIRKGLRLRLRTMGLNPCAVDEELLDLMKTAGFADVDLGAESGCNETLSGLGKNFGANDVLQAGELLRRWNIPTTWYLLFGAPGETPETVTESLATITQAAGNNNLICAGIGIRAYKGSPIAESMRRANSQCSEDDFLRPVDYHPERITLEEIKRLVQLARFQHPNIFITPDDQTFPLFLQALGVFLLRVFGSRQPIWKWFILLRKLEMVLGINRVKYWLWLLRNKGPATSKQEELS